MPSQPLNTGEALTASLDPTVGQGRIDKVLPLLTTSVALLLAVSCFFGWVPGANWETGLAILAAGGVGGFVMHQGHTA